MSVQDDLSWTRQISQRLFFIPVFVCAKKKKNLHPGFYLFDVFEQPAILKDSVAAAGNGSQVFTSLNNFTAGPGLV